ncbi:MAG: flagellar filament capping protein FliD [Sulfuricurvum sp.]|uniref:flagellar filament capping protein FliD n=1 Tax=Sulfuricurvum sp. TaxID=2025608 RepID=UPI00262E6F9E|nr:flagellar filament capping protein FliD [Sulfuricurvum sp.]MDD2830171.1 flagellar filament capping protein FliD [Sulfuricurvum sp.]MDD4949235.1 flagellar filament capping protein FliD [Sulfuricurvum sp.]
MAVSSLGAGSGVLTQTVIDQLKAADTKSIITPIDNKITLQQQKSSAISLLDSLLTTFKSSASALDNDALYQKRTVSGNTSGVSVTANSGVDVQSFSISNVSLAQKNVLESGSFLSNTASIASGSGTMKMTVGGLSYSIDYTSTTSLTDLKNSINTVAGSSVRASILQVGTNDYRLVMNSQKTGADQNIVISDSSTGTLNNTLTSYKAISSQAFSSPIDTVASGAGDLTVSVGGSSYNVAYDASTSLENIRDLINASVGSSVATIDGNNKLILRSSVAGDSASVSLTDNSGLLDSKLTTTTAMDKIGELQAATNAQFKYNGITISRSSNTISDLTVGVTINLLENSGSANISIAQDTQAISDEMNTFVQNYNSLTSQLNSMTSSDTTTGTVGIFSGDNSINSIRREINRVVTSMNSSGMSLSQFGIDLSETGTMSFNSSTFLSKFNTDTTASEKFLSGYTKVDSLGHSTTTDGIFTTLNTMLDRFHTNMTNLTTSSTNQIKSLNDNKTRSQALLDARYTAMTAQFVQYDTIMTKLKNQFASLQTQISAYTTGN